jgi:hypothetical protein
MVRPALSVWVELKPLPMNRFPRMVYRPAGAVAD